MHETSHHEHLNFSTRTNVQRVVHIRTISVELKFSVINVCLWLRSVFLIIRLFWLFVFLDLLVLDLSYQHDYSLLLQYNSMPNCYAVTFYYRRVIYFFPLKKVWNLLSIFFMLSTSYRYTNQTYVFMYLKHNTKNYNFLLFLYLFYFIKIYVHLNKIRESFNEKIHQKC